MLPLFSPHKGFFPFLHAFGGDGSPGPASNGLTLPVRYTGRKAGAAGASPAGEVRCIGR